MPYVRGTGDYTKVPDWRWQWYPPPYRRMSPVQAPKSNYYPTYAPASQMGLGCAGECSCGGKCGMGAIDFSVQGTGIADKIQSYLPITSHFSIPNWVPYGLLGLLVVPK